MNIDITYCSNMECKQTSCVRHPFWADRHKLNSFTEFTDCQFYPKRDATKITHAVLACDDIDGWDIARP